MTRWPLALLLLIPAACAPPATDFSKPSGTSSTSPAASPTAQDQVLAARFEQLLKELDGSNGTEIANLVRDSSPQVLAWLTLSPDNLPRQALDRLAGRLPGTPAQLEQARNIYARLLVALEAAQTMPAWPPYPIARRQGPIQLDGRLDEPAWQQAQPQLLTYQFPQFTPTNLPTATVRLLWDQNNLYAAFDVPDNQIMVKEFVRDDDTFLFDCVELFLWPQEAGMGYWELEVTPHGGIVDHFIVKYPKRWAGFVRPEATLAGLGVGITLHRAGEIPETGTGYCVELSIPWKELPGFTTPPTPGQEMRGLMAWSNVTGQFTYDHQKYLSDVPTVNGFQDVWSYRRWVFQP